MPGNAPGAPRSPRPAQLWVFAGPNGAGKSTLVARHVRGRLPVVNADELARGLPPGRDGAPDVLGAGRLALAARERHLTARESFVVETTLSGQGELALMRRAREVGYRVNLVYVGIASPQQSAVRVAERVRQGGHDVPGADILRRYERSLANLAGALQVADRAYVLDNAGQRARLLLSREQGRVKHVARALPDWAQRAIPMGLRTGRSHHQER